MSSCIDTLVFQRRLNLTNIYTEYYKVYSHNLLLIINKLHIFAFVIFIYYICIKRYYMEERIEKVLDFASKHFGVTKDDIIGKKHFKDMSFARSIVFRFLKCEMGYSTNALSRIFGRARRVMITSLNKSRSFNKADENIYQEFVDLYKKSHPS